MKTSSILIGILVGWIFGWAGASWWGVAIATAATLLYMERKK